MNSNECCISHSLKTIKLIVNGIKWYYIWYYISINKMTRSEITFDLEV